MQTQTSAIAERFVTVYGQKLHYFAAGEANQPVIVILHGLISEASEWLQNIEVLSKQFHVIAPDLLGCGQSDKPLINYRIGTFVDYLNGFLQTLDCDRVSLIGNSLGAVIAINFALTYPNKVDKLVNVSGGFGYALPEAEDPQMLGFTPGSLKLLNPSTQAEVRELLALALYNQEVAQMEETVNYVFTVANNSSHINQRIVELLKKREDALDGKLATLTHPTLILWGKQDKLTPVNLGDRFQAELPNSRLIVFDECAHNPYVEQLDRFNTQVLRFLSEIETA
jgi:2-hydroxy-6-oxonona-2,4-dienedioate hydrolase